VVRPSREWLINLPASYIFMPHKDPKIAKTYAAEYYIKNKIIMNQYRKNHRKLHGSTSKRRRLDLIKILGGKCIICGYDNNVRALCVDHINGKGSVERKTFGSLLKFYRFYVNNPDKAKQILQVLCCNCSAIKMEEKKEYWMGGMFPHAVTDTSFALNANV
jgi:hypothetical protein